MEFIAENLESLIGLLIFLLSMQSGVMVGCLSAYILLGGCK